MKFGDHNSMSSPPPLPPLRLTLNASLEDIPKFLKVINLSSVIKDYKIL